LLTLGCARNEVDSEELAARLTAGGWEVTTDGSHADVVLVNTCGFIEKAKRESIDTLLAAADTGAPVVATGCLAQRYGRELAESLPEATAVLGFAHYPEIADRLADVLAGRSISAAEPVDRRTLLPLAPVERASVRAAQRSATAGGRPSATAAAQLSGAAATVEGPRDAPARHSGGASVGIPAHLRGVLRQRLTGGPVAPLKLASGCDRRCAFCAIPSFRGAFVSRTPDEVLAEAEWLAREGVRELVLVSENSTSYGKDLGDPSLLSKLLPQLAATPGIVRVRVSYLQPSEIRPDLIEAVATTPGVAPYFDLSFQHAAEPVLRRMRRFGSSERFLKLLSGIRELDPKAGARSNVIVGFPGETRADMAELERFLGEARLDAIGVFDYSDEEGTEAATLPGKVTAATIRRRYARLSALADELCDQRAAERIGTTVDVLVDSVRDGVVEGRAAHQAPEVDGCTTLTGGTSPDLVRDLVPGDLVRAVVTGSEGVDLVARVTEIIATGRHS
jgi:ribosomal protein S12 methylthiotransferase